MLRNIDSTSVIRRVLPFILFTAAVIPFLPILSNDFVSWDDRPMLVDNPHFRGFSSENLRWMFTTFHMGHYQPLSWLTFAVNHHFGGMNPFGYHAVNLVLHGMNAVLVYLLAVSLMSKVLQNGTAFPYGRVHAAAAFASLLFAVHPLRVESVAWATQRRDVLGAFFLLISLGMYLRAVESQDDRRTYRLSMASSLVAYVLSLLSKAGGMGLPFVLLVLDGYPLRRFSGGEGPGRPSRGIVLREKIPFLLPAVVFAFLAARAQSTVTALVPIELYGVAARLAQASYGVLFYLWATVVPVGLSPLYEIPAGFDPSAMKYVFCGLGVMALAAVCVWSVRRYPAVTVAAACYLLFLAPVLGFAQSGSQFAADRYTYMATLPWVILLGAGLHRSTASCRSESGSSCGIQPRLIFGAAAAVLVLLAVMTWRQTGIWRDTETLWRHAASVHPKSFYSQYNLGQVLHEKGKYPEAVEPFRMAADIRPDLAKSNSSLGIALFDAKRVEESIPVLERAVLMDPTHPVVRQDLGMALARQGRMDESVWHLREAVRLQPDNARANHYLGLLLAEMGRFDEARKCLCAARDSLPPETPTRRQLEALIGKLPPPRDAR